MDLKATVGRGAVWGVGGTVAAFFLTFGFSVALARILDPRDFGLHAMAFVFAAKRIQRTDPAVQATVVYRKDADPVELDSLHWFAVLHGAAACLVMAVGAPLIGLFYADPQVVDVARALALTYFITGFGLVAAGLLRRDLHYRSVEMLEPVAVLFGGGVAVAMAATGWGVWSLVARSLVGAVVAASFGLLLSGFRPRLRFRFSSIVVPLRYTGRLMASNVLTHASSHLDHLIVGRALGASSLGFYERGLNAPTVVASPAQRVAQTTWLPALVQMRHDPSRVKDGVLRGIGIAALATTPVLSGVAAVAPEFIGLVYGDKWLAAVPVLMLAAPALLLRAVSTPLLSIFLSHGRADAKLRWDMVTTPVLLVGLVLGATLGGVKGVAAALTVVTVLLFVPQCRVAGQLAGIGFRDVWVSIWRPFVGGLAITVVVTSLRPWLGEVSMVIRLLGLATAGALSFFATMAVLRPTSLRDLRDLLVGR